ncbi:uncharacterized protein LOC131890397 [Tigriopus californicus]|nr:uncharacterized protein LOC131890397 [Tigriopus californicus]
MCHSRFGVTLLFHSIVIVAVSEGDQAFLGMEVGPMQWPSLISGEAQWVKTRLECAATCNQDPNCNLFAWGTGHECLVGSSTGSYSFLPPQSDSQILFIDKDSMTSFLSLSSVPGTLWTGFMFERIEGISSPEICAIYCGLIFYPQCQIYVQTAQNCYLGDIYRNKTLFNTTFSERTDIHLTEFFINKTNNEERDTQKYIIENTNATDWHPPIYDVITTASSELECSAHCTFENDPHCHLYIFDTSTNNCLLGNFNNNDSATSEGSGTNNVGVQPGFYMEWFKTIFPTSEGARSEDINQFIYVGLHREGWTNEVCGTLCYWDDACQMFYYNYNRCFLGNIYVTEGFNGGHDAKVFFKNESTFDMGFATDPERFMPFQVYSTGWFEYVKAIRPNVTSLDQCGLHCRFYREGCNFMILVEDYCILGNPYEERHADEWHEEYANITRGIDIVYLNIGYYETALKEIYLNQSLPGSAWSPMVYETHDVLNLKYCKCVCFFKTADCHGFLFDETTLKCYLTRDQVNSNVVTETKTLLWHYFKHKTAIIVGGHDENEEVDGKMNIILRGGYECKSAPLPDFTALEAYETGTVTHGPRVMINGGYAYKTDEMLASGHILDLSAPERKWVQCGSMLNARMSHQLFNLGDKIGVVGGYNKNGSVSVLEAYDFNTDSWSLLKDSANNTVTLP